MRVVPEGSPFSRPLTTTAKSPVVMCARSYSVVTLLRVGVGVRVGAGVEAGFRIGIRVGVYGQGQGQS